MQEKVRLDYTLAQKNELSFIFSAHFLNPFLS